MFKIIVISNIRAITVGINTVVETEIQYPDADYNLIAVSSVLGNLVDLSEANYNRELFRFNIGKSTNNKIQYTITESNNPANGHWLILLFVRKFD